MLANIKFEFEFAVASLTQLDLKADSRELFAFLDTVNQINTHTDLIVLGMSEIIDNLRSRSIMINDMVENDFYEELIPFLKSSYPKRTLNPIMITNYEDEQHFPASMRPCVTAMPIEALRVFPNAKLTDYEEFEELLPNAKYFTVVYYEEKTHFKLITALGDTLQTFHKSRVNANG